MKYYVYRCFAVRDKLLYVGCSGNVEKRCAFHRYRSQWFGDVRRVDVERGRSKDAARAREAEVVLSEQPPHNIALRRKRRAGIPRAEYLAECASQRAKVLNLLRIHSVAAVALAMDMSTQRVYKIRNGATKRANGKRKSGK